MGEPGLSRLASLQSNKARRRISRSTAALLLAVAIVSGLFVLSQSFVASISGGLGDAFRGDVIVDSGTVAKGGSASSLIDTLRRDPAVESLVEWRPGLLFVSGGSQTLRIAGMNGDHLFDTLDLGLVSGSKPVLSTGGIAVERETASRLNLRIGDSVPVVWQKGTSQPLVVEAIYDSTFGRLLGDAIVDVSLVNDNIPLSPTVLGFMKLRSGGDSELTRTALDATAKRYGAKGVVAVAQLVESRSELLSGFGRIIQWMLGFSVVLALLGVANTLQLSIRERVIDFGLARAVGATRGQMVRLVLAEAVGMSLAGSVLGLALGVASAYAGTTILGDYGLNSFVLSWAPLLLIAVAAAAFGLACALMPALSVSRIAPLAAIAGAQGLGSRASRKKSHKRRPTDVGNPAMSNIVDPATADMPQGDGVTDMPQYCYHCGNEPGAGDRCQSCGARQSSAPMGIFSVRPDPRPAEPSSAPPSEQPPEDRSDHHSKSNSDRRNPFSSWADDVEHLDAEVIDDPIEPPTARPAPPVGNYDDHDEAEVVDAAVISDDFTDHVEPPLDTPVGAGSLGSIFESARDHFAASPFATGMNSPSEPPGSAQRQRWSLVDPVEEDLAEDEPHPSTFVPSPPSRPKASVFDGVAPSDGSDPNTGAESASTLSTQHERAAEVPESTPRPHEDLPASFGDPVVAPPMRAEPDSFGLFLAVERLSPTTRAQSKTALAAAAARLQHPEQVTGALGGHIDQRPCAVISTDQRVIIATERGWVPDVEELMISPSLLVHGKHDGGIATIDFVHDEHTVTVTEISDVSAAVDMANKIRAAKSITRF